MNNASDQETFSVEMKSKLTPGFEEGKKEKKKILCPFSGQRKQKLQEKGRRKPGLFEKITTKAGGARAD